jgi:chromate transporter
MPPADSLAEPTLSEIAREWGRIGCIGFGGPPAHVALFRVLCVTQRGWLTEEQFERAIAATNLLPGPASTQLAIYCAWRLGGPKGALIGGLGFILPGLVLILALSALFLSGSPPAWIRGAGMGAGAAVAPVAVRAGLGVTLPIWRRSAHERSRVLAYALAGGVAAAMTGPWLVLVLLGCGAIELAWNGKAERFIRTMLGGWAYGAIYHNSTERTAALDGWLWYYNTLCRGRHNVFYAEVRVMPMWGRDWGVGAVIAVLRSA